MRFREFVEDEQGQDLVEYTMLMAFVCLTGAAFYIGLGQNVNAIWSTVNARLASAGATGES